MKNDILKEVILHLNDEHLILLFNFGQMTKRIGGKQGKRMKSLRKDISLAIEHTCNCLSDVCYVSYFVLS